MSTVITHKTFPNDKKYEMELAGRPFSIEVGKYAELANAAAMVKYGETTVMVAVTASPRPRDGVDFFPLSVDFEEKLYAVGRIPGSFMRREGRPSLPAVLASRLIDRPMRPLFPSDLRNDVCITCTVMSLDRDCSPEVTAMIGASAMVAISDIPWNGPIGCCEVGYIRRQVQEGHQVYIVCPAVEESETAGAAALKNVTAYAKQLQTEVFPDLRISLVHGKLSAKAKEAAMAAFSAGEADILVATTVIEVGVDVPNATLMVIENADRFGLSQLHQLRGRVGRGKAKSYCVLLSANRSSETRQRLKALCATNDGFKIAEKDLELRGPGDFFGSRQHGLPQLQVADLAGDTRVLAEAKEAAEALLADDPELKKSENQPVLNHIRTLFEENPDIFN